jgi:Protein of unknown function (DUF2934)
MEADRDDKIKARAYQLWEEEGRPEGRAEQHWFTAKESVAVEENQASTYLPIDSGMDPEPIEAIENAGEFPTLTDQGELRVPGFDEEDETPPANN